MQTPPTIPVQVKRTYPHDATAFTQGLVIAPDGKSYYESNGRYGLSDIRQVELSTGRVLQQYRLGRRYFAEGLALLHDRLWQLTWREQAVFKYDPTALARGAVEQQRWPLEGWGLTATDQHLVLSDGSATLYFLEPATLRVVKKLAVKVAVNGRPQLLKRLNELEFVEGYIYANVWLSSRIAVIHPETGYVVKWLELKALLPPNRTVDMTANGVAYDRQRKRLYVTGKLWSHLYEIAV